MLNKNVKKTCDEVCDVFGGMFNQEQEPMA
jgi:hypothetical protein